MATIKNKKQVLHKKNKKNIKKYIFDDHIDDVISDEEIVENNPFDKKYVTIRKNNYSKQDEQIDDNYDPHFDLILDENPFDKKSVKIIVPNKKMVTCFPNALLLEDEKIVESEKTTNTNNKTSVKIKIKSNNPDDILDIIEEYSIKNKINTSHTHSETLTDVASETISTETAISLTDGQCTSCKKIGYLIEETHENSIICSYCGVVNEILLDHGPEWRQFNDDQKGEVNGRCGAPSNFFFPQSTQGTVMTGIGSSRLKRKQKWNSMVYKERSLNNVFEFIKKKCADGGIPKSISDTAQIMYKKINDSTHKTGINEGKQIIIRGDNRISIIAACVFKSCEMNKNPRSIREIAKVFSIDEKKVTKGNKQYDKLIKNSDELAMIDKQITGNTAEDFIRRHAGKLGMTADEMNLAARVARNCERLKLVSDHNPYSVAAGAIFVMMDYTEYTYDKKEIAQLLETSDVTINKIYAKISPLSEALIDDDATTFFIKKFKING